MKSLFKFHVGRWAMGLIALVTLMLVACGGSEAPATAAPAPTSVIPAQPVIIDVPNTAVPEAVAEPTAIPKASKSAKDTVRIVTEGEPNALGFTTGLLTLTVLDGIGEDYMQDPLTWIDNDTFEVIPLSPVESWEQLAPDRWQFKLREGVKFHNGAEWNAEQAKFWIDCGGDEETGGNSNANAYSYHGAQKGVAVDRLTLDIICGEACPILPRTMTFVKFTDVEWWKGATEDERSAGNPGMGPYQLVELRRGIVVELEIFED